MARRGIRYSSKQQQRKQTVEGFAREVIDDLFEEIDVQFNELIREVISDLTFGVGGSKGTQWKTVSTTLTGFFSSSWKASLTPVQGTEDRKGKWAKMEIVSIGEKPNREYVLAPGQKPIRKIRHYIPKDFRFPLDRSVYIGNTVNVDYLARALASKKESNQFEWYAAGGALDRRIDSKFVDRPNINVAGFDI